MESLVSSPADEAKTTRPSSTPVKALTKLTRDLQKEPKAAPKPEITTNFEGKKTSIEMAKLQENFRTVIRCSNATPIRTRHGLGYTCYFCDLQFLEPADLKAHTLEFHADFRQTSSTRLPTLSNYSVKLDITTLTCKFCFQLFDQLSTFIDHLRLTHREPFHTDVKNYMLPFRFDSDPLKCAICDGEMQAFRAAVEHMNSHYRNHICEVCGAGFVNQASWRVHRRNHEYGDFPCPKCPQVFSSIVKLKYHDRCVHLGLDKRNKCPLCNEKFNCLVIKNNHMVKAHGAPPTVAKCKACDKAFNSYQSLRVHEKSFHLLEKKYKCTECEMRFLTRRALDDHMVKHTRTRDFICNICNKAYGRRDTLREHLRIHANDRKYKCEHCKMAFVQKCSLKSHLISRHK